MSTTSHRGTLFIVATPIGNLGDITLRAIDILKQVDVIAAEDTRHSRRLTGHFGIVTPLLALHDFNEKERTASLLEKLAAGLDIALISDAGTPLISDPGYHLVHEAGSAGYKVVPVPGVSALTAALSAAGLPTDRFCFEGFLPAKSGNRIKLLQELRDETRTLVFYESPHRILGALADIAEVLGNDRQTVIARELTKQYETFYRGSIGQVQQVISAHEDNQRGEFVVMVAGAQSAQESHDVDPEHLMQVLLEELPVKQAASLGSRITGQPRNRMYQLALRLKEDRGSPD